MKQKRYSDEQIAFALRQVENGIKVEEACRKLGVSERDVLTLEEAVCPHEVVEIRRLQQPRRGKC